MYKMCVCVCVYIHTHILANTLEGGDENKKGQVRMSNTSEPMMRQLLYTDRRKSCALARATTDWMVSHWEEGGTTQCLCDQTYLFLWKPQLLLKLTN
jgi:hypothetical protein